LFKTDQKQLFQELGGQEKAKQVVPDATESRKLDSCQLLFVCVYMPHEGDDSMTDEFVNQLSVTESIIESN